MKLKTLVECLYPKRDNKQQATPDPAEVASLPGTRNVVQVGPKRHKARAPIMFFTAAAVAGVAIIGHTLYGAFASKANHLMSAAPADSAAEGPALAAPKPLNLPAYRPPIAAAAAEPAEDRPDIPNVVVDLRTSHAPPESKDLPPGMLAEQQQAADSGEHKPTPREIARARKLEGDIVAFENTQPRAALARKADYTGTAGPPGLAATEIPGMYTTDAEAFDRVAHEQEIEDEPLGGIDAPAMLGRGVGPRGRRGRAQDPNEGALAQRLAPMAQVTARASVLAERDLIATRGTMAQCSLITAIDSTQPGMVTCVSAKPLYSASGNVVLAEAGSKYVGEYQRGIEQGQNRLFVLWTRLETPKGVLIDLDSPGTDALGRSGHAGYVDTKFWPRFGAALMFSIIDDSFAVLAARETDGTVITNNTRGAAQEAMTEILKRTAALAPSLIKHQGDAIAIHIARDLDFSSVYQLRPLHAAER